MTYVLGASADDDINIAALSVGAGNSGPYIFWGGWWKPTTLTAGRGYYSFGQDFGIEVDATTSELKLRSNNATTDGEWVTSDANIMVDQWCFLMFFLSPVNTGPTAAWRAWLGTADTPPRELSISNTVTPVGNFSGSTTFHIGNKGTQSLAFQGLVDWQFMFAVRVDSPSQTTNPVHISTQGVISNTTAEFMLRRYVYPAWLGDLVLMRDALPQIQFGTTPNDTWFWPALGSLVYSVARSDGAGFMSGQQTVQINGATLSQERGPVPAGLVRHLAQGCDSLPRAA